MECPLRRLGLENVTDTHPNHDLAGVVPLLEALDPEQRQVAEALRGPVRVLAGAGTGKTRAVSRSCR